MAVTGTEQDGSRSGSSVAAWAPTSALRRAVVVILVLLLPAVVFGRVDLVLVATPFVLGTAWALRTRPRTAPEVTLSSASRAVVEGGELSAEVTVTNPDPAPYDLVLLEPTYSSWLHVDDGDQVLAVPVGADRAVTVTVSGEALRWGWQRFGPVETYAVACEGLMRSERVSSPTLALRVFPWTDHFDAVDAVPKAAGMVGAHRSRWYGDGGELAGVRQFAPGDRLRRIDWRTSLRARELHVAQTLSDRDAEVVLLLDLLHEAGDSSGVHGRASVLDTAVRACAGIAEHYLGVGDRVRALEYGGRGRALRPASGRRHYLTLLEWLLAVQAGEGASDPTARLFRQHLVPSTALIVVLTPLLESRSVGMLARLARSGRSVVAVDTLPADVAPAAGGRWSDIAHRFWRLERRNTVDQLLEHGVPVVPWAGAGTLDQVLRDVSRMAAGRR